MNTKHAARGISGWLLVAVLLCGTGAAKAASMAVVGRSPANGAVEVCVDTRLSITFVTTPIMPAAGALQIWRASDGVIVYQLNLQSLTNPPAALGWPYQINLGGKSVNYLPFAVSGTTVDIQPPIRLAYNTEYYIKMSEGFCRDSSGNTSPAIFDSTTWRFTTKASAPAADHDYTVALDGTGDFCTLQGATDAVANNDSTRTLIRLRNGTYRELVNVPSTKKNVTWLGQDKDSTVVAAFNNNAFNDTGSSSRCMVEVSASDFRMYNMTLRNTTPQGGSQAESIKVNGPARFLAQNCKFYSYQDTLLVGGTVYFGNSYIEGDVDYIWGYGTVFFQSCELRNLRTGGYINQARNGSGVLGYFFVDCKLTAPAGISGMWLARIDQAGFPYSQVVFINTIMQSGVIAAQGWNIYGSGSTANLQFWEYKSVDQNGNPVNVASRHAASRQLSDAEALYWRNPANVLSGWDPNVTPGLPTAAWQPQPASGAAGVDGGGVTLKWAAGAAATSHLVYFGTVNPPSLVGEQTATSLASGALTPGAVYYWRVDEKNAAGTTAGTVWSFTAVTDGIAPTPNPMTWATVPHATGYSTIEMIATTATDPSGVEYFFTNTTVSGHNSGWQDSNTYSDTGLTPLTVYAYTVQARDKSPVGNTTAASVARSAMTSAAPDTTPPSPNPMTWSVAPHGEDLHSISMTATTATDASGVEYLFTCTSGGGHDSGWQDEATYVDTGLAEGATCSYNVRARDKSPAQNTTSPSTPDASASALLDSAAPTPSPMTFDITPHATSIDSIAMKATEANDVSGVEYFFACTAGGGHNSGWRDDPNWTDTGLTNNATYTYRAIARDKSVGHNETTWSEPGSATTLRYLCTPGSIATDLSTDCQMDFLDYAMLAATWNAPLPLTNNIAVNGDFATDIVPGWVSFALPTATGSWMSGLDYGYGNPPEAAYMICDMSGGDVAGYFFYQVIPVTPGTRYKLSAEWMGDLAVGSSDPCSTSNWTSVIVTFESGTDPAAWHWTEPNAVMYKKVWGIGSLNTDPSGAWGWESIGLARTNGPADDVYVATDSYMVVAFSMGGIAGATSPWVDIDNIKVEGPGCPSVDFNGDCSLDMKDLAVFAEQWLICNRNPAGECWQ